MLKIRLRRMGSRHRPFYRVVVSDSRRVPTASAVEEIGYYDPRRDPALLEINEERAEYWLGHGAQLSSTVKTLLARVSSGKTGAPAAKEEAPAAPAAKEEAPAAEETAPVEAAPAEAKAADTSEEPAAAEEAPEKEKAEEG